MVLEKKKNTHSDLDFMISASCCPWRGRWDRACAQSCSRIGLQCLIHTDTIIPTTPLVLWKINRKSILDRIKKNAKKKKLHHSQGKIQSNQSQQLWLRPSGLSWSRNTGHPLRQHRDIVPVFDNMLNTFQQFGQYLWTPLGSWYAQCRLDNILHNSTTYHRLWWR